MKKTGRSIEDRISVAKSEVFPELEPREWELHAYDIWNSKNFFAGRRMRINHAKKLEIFSKITDLACELDITIVGVVMFKDRMEGTYSSPAVVNYSWDVCCRAV